MVIPQQQLPKRVHRNTPQVDDLIVHTLLERKRDDPRLMCETAANSLLWVREQLEEAGAQIGATAHA